MSNFHQRDMHDSYINQLVSEGKTFTLDWGAGLTYATGKITLYAWGFYPKHSLLYGQSCRIWVEDFDSIDEAMAFIRHHQNRLGRQFRFTNHIITSND